MPASAHGSHCVAWPSTHVTPQRQLVGFLRELPPPLSVLSSLHVPHAIGRDLTNHKDRSEQRDRQTDQHLEYRL
jgi:hypothetical protein